MEGESVFPEMSIFVPNFQHSTFNTMNVSTFNGMTSKQPQTATLEEVATWQPGNPFRKTLTCAQEKIFSNKKKE